MKRLVLAACAAAAGAALIGQQAAPPPTPTPRLFDSKRPPERELETSIADGFTLAAVGDLIMERPLSQLLPGDPGFAAVVRIVREANVAFGNFENVAIDPSRTPAPPYPGRGDVSLVADPAVGRDLAKLGFDLVSRANNHAMDWGVQGMRETTRVLDEAGLVHAGVGENRGEARAARYLETPQGRVALVSMASTFSEFQDAMPPRGRRPGPARPVGRARHPELRPPEGCVRQASRRSGRRGRPRQGLRGHEHVRARAAREGRKRARRNGHVPRHGVPGRRARVDALRDGSRWTGTRSGGPSARASSTPTCSSRRSMPTRPASGCEEPGDFLPVLAHEAIDAGAGVFIAHGEHRLMPIEIYKGRPIFYSLANFFWCDILEPIPEETFEANRGLLTRAYGDPQRATDQDLLTVWNVQGFDDPRVFQTIVAVCRWEKGRVAEVRLYPVDLGYGERLTVERDAAAGLAGARQGNPDPPPTHLQAVRDADRHRAERRRDSPALTRPRGQTSRALLRMNPYPRALRPHEEVPCESF